MKQGLLYNFDPKISYEGFKIYYFYIYHRILTEIFFVKSLRKKKLYAYQLNFLK